MTTRLAGMSRENVLVSTSWASSRLADDSVIFLEVDEDVTAYHTDGHIPGAVALNWRTDLQQEFVRDVVDRERFGELLSERGISRDHTIVVYGGNHNWFAAYAYWYLRLYGHADVRLLDGGRMKWEREGLPQEGGRQRGHIPGAVSVPWNRAVTRDGTFRPDDELRRIYADLIDDPDRRVVAYCRIGERSSHTWFVLHELLGQSHVVNYDGSWVEYGSLIGVPVER